MPERGFDELVERLILARLLVPSAKPPLKGTVQKSLATLFAQQLSEGEWRATFEAAIGRLTEHGWLTSKPLALTEGGRAEAMRYWGLAEIPARLRWEQLKRRTIVPRLLDLDPDALAGKDAAKALAVAVLRSTHRLPATAATPAAVMNALAWKELGLDSAANFSAAGVVSKRLLQTDRTLSTDEVAKLAARQALAATGPDLFTAAIRRSIQQATRATPRASASDSSPPLDEAEPNLDDFVGETSRAAARLTTGRFGDHKVFIAHVWRALTQEPTYRDISLERFKERLLDAHRARQLTLSRADLVERMDPRDVEESEIDNYSSKYHFINQ